MSLPSQGSRCCGNVTGQGFPTGTPATSCTQAGGSRLRESREWGLEVGVGSSNRPQGGECVCTWVRVCTCALARMGVQTWGLYVHGGRCRVWGASNQGWPREGRPPQPTKWDTSAQVTGQPQRAPGGPWGGRPSVCPMPARLAGGAAAGRGSPEGPLLRLPELPADKTWGPSTWGQTPAAWLAALLWGSTVNQAQPRRKQPSRFVPSRDHTGSRHPQGVLRPGNIVSTPDSSDVQGSTGPCEIRRPTHPYRRARPPSTRIKDGLGVVQTWFPS